LFSQRAYEVVVDHGKRRSIICGSDLRDQSGSSSQPTMRVRTYWQRPPEIKRHFHDELAKLAIQRFGI
jgi:hypothetical protein